MIKEDVGRFGIARAELCPCRLVQVAAGQHLGIFGVGRRVIRRSLLVASKPIVDVTKRIHRVGFGGPQQGIFPERPDGLVVVACPGKVVASLIERRHICRQDGYRLPVICRRGGKISRERFLLGYIAQKQYVAGRKRGIGAQSLKPAHAIAIQIGALDLKGGAVEG